MWHRSVTAHLVEPRVFAHCGASALRFVHRTRDGGEFRKETRDGIQRGLRCNSDCRSNKGQIFSRATSKLLFYSRPCRPFHRRSSRRVWRRLSAFPCSVRRRSHGHTPAGTFPHQNLVSFTKHPSTSCAVYSNLLHQALHGTSGQFDRLPAMIHQGCAGDLPTEVARET